MEDLRESRFDTAVRAVCDRVEKYLRLLPRDVKDQAQEVRLRINRPIAVYCAGGMYFLNQNGRLECRPSPQSMLATAEDVEETFRKVCSYSVYSHQNEIKNGYVTMTGGHRVGISGTAVLQSGVIAGLRDISSINIRIARQILGAASYLLREVGKDIRHGLLLAGPPASGKTTLLRDIARQLSNGFSGVIRKVAVVDERGELAGACLGVPQNDLGFCSDILDGYPKGEGILQAVRTLSPEYVVCDELGGEADAAAIEEGMNAGVALVCSIHAGSVRELLQRSQARRLLRTGGFETVALLAERGEPGKVTGIYKAGDLLVEMAGGDFAGCGGIAGRICGVA